MRREKIRKREEEKKEGKKGKEDEREEAVDVDMISDETPSDIKEDEGEIR